ncbi:MAG: PadR family transcriptional regulator [Negativicutes bacterium]|nr:PadR family transcriptional regulator [Negativicutes bacterium]
MIQTAILGLLNKKAMSGYDLKKAMQDSLIMYWSGNNNQIYKVLLELKNQGLVSCQTEHQESAPSKKVYTITAQGRITLQEQLCSLPIELPEFKKPFLIQFANADVLSKRQWQELMLNYQTELRNQLLLQKRKQQQELEQTNCSAEEHWLAAMLYENIIGFYQTELNWTERVLWGQSNLRQEE